MTRAEGFGASNQPGHIRRVAESGSDFRASATSRWAVRVEGTALHVIQAFKPEPPTARFGRTARSGRAASEAGSPRISVRY
jgi:hypothetical protein